MKVVVTTKGEGSESKLDPRFGRAAGFLLIDTESGESLSVDNSKSIQAAQGAGIKAAEVVSKLGAECLITGHCGPKAFRALHAAGIKIYTCTSDTVAEALAQLEAGELNRAGSPDVGGHWG